MRYCFLRFPEGKFKAVSLSYDDGVSADIRLAGILDRYGMKGTFNINSGFFGMKGKMTPEEIQKHILDAGHEVAVHGENHIAPGVARPGIAIADILNCRLDLEKRFGRIIRGMAYPDSGIRTMHGENKYSAIREYVKDLGIVYSRTLGSDNDNFRLPEDFIAWMPTAHHNNPKLKEYVEKFVSLREDKLYSASRFPRLFYLWGHSYEFDNDNNWERIERFAEIVGNREDVWYATNIEIYDYVQAYERLQFNTKATFVTNPSASDVWFVKNGELVMVKAGESKTI